ncbi:tetratricopeptide repeat protein [Desulfohalobiaceae bacterium Ax17]|uniref:tetratricopeptide repeat protein n=1 Tax=Desulfovulcanus ferrireducens TaxID=2831190 RepID=UPI00207BB123|nr:tetratricopeptide repeat protein [Desulfovulcanus ferrireducens]MBT8763605.1 tetratricopeptide repeat protein [Desulfovulcanus ferrireducens]
MVANKIPAIVCTASDLNFENDKHNLECLGIRITNRFSSGIAVIDYAKFNKLCLVIADNQLSDMSVIDLVHKLQNKLQNKFIPIVVISDRSERDFVLDIIAAGCTGFVIRPYHLKTLQEHIKNSLSLFYFNEIDDELLKNAMNDITKGNYDHAIESLNEIIDVEKKDAQYYFDLGNSYLLEEKFTKAIIAFNKALKINNLFIKAYKGLAEAYKGKNNIKKYKYYLSKCAEEYAKRDNFEEVKKLFIEILKVDPYSPNPYNNLGINLRKKGQYNLAIDAYRKALALDPKDENIYFNMAKAYFFMKQYADAKKFTLKALNLNPNFAVAETLLKNLNKKLKKYAQS